MQHARRCNMHPPQSSHKQASRELKGLWSRFGRTQAFSPRRESQDIIQGHDHTVQPLYYSRKLRSSKLRLHSTTGEVGNCRRPRQRLHQMYRLAANMMSRRIVCTLSSNFCASSWSPITFAASCSGHRSSCRTSAASTAHSAASNIHMSLFPFVSTMTLTDARHALMSMTWLACN